MLDSIRRFSIDELSDDERSAAATAHGEYFAQLAEPCRFLLGQRASSTRH